jgi:hypothetical protein
MFSVINCDAEKYSLKKIIIDKLTIVTAIIIAKTILPPRCHPKIRLINQPQLKLKIESTNHTAKFNCPKSNRFVFKKFEKNKKTASKTAAP